MEMSDGELDRILAKQARDRDQREAAARIADRYISRDGGEPTNAERKAKAGGLTVIDGDKAEPKSGASVLDKTYAFIGRFVAYPSDHARVAHSYGLLTRMLWIAGIQRRACSSRRRSRHRERAARLRSPNSWCRTR